MFTTPIPGLQLFSMVNRAESPLMLLPYPMLVGTAITGDGVRPLITLGRAPSMPATVIMILADLIISRL